MSNFINFYIHLGQQNGRNASRYCHCVRVSVRAHAYTHTHAHFVIKLRALAAFEG